MEIVDSTGNVFGKLPIQVIGPDGKPKTTGGGSPTGPAGGDLTGFYPNPGVNWSNGLPTYNLSYYPLSSNPAGYLTGITSGQIVTALGYTPYSTANPSGYISGITSLDVTTALGYTPYNATNPAGYITSAALSPYLTSTGAALIYYPIPTGTTSQYIRGDGSLATFPTIPSVTPSPLTKVDDTNVTLTLGGTPSTALLQSVSLTVGWTGTLADSRIASATNWNTAYTNRITSLTTTGSSGAATLLANTLNIPNYTLAGLGGVPTTRTLTINGTTQDLSADRTWNIGTVTNVTGTSPIASSGGTTPAISIADAIADGTTKGAASFNANDFSSLAGNISIDYTNAQSASSSTKGFLTSTDWSTFNSKQNALTNPVTGTGTNNEIAAFNSTGSTITSLTTATYPSLTELSYVKGVTSAIQTQLNAKEPTITNGFGITGTTTKAVSLTSAEAFITATVSISAATYADVTGASITLAAGTWLIMANIYGYTSNALMLLNAAITDSSNTIVTEGAAGSPSSGSASANTWVSVALSAIVTPAGSTTYKLRAARGNTSITSTITIADGSGQNVTNNTSSNTDKGTGLRAIRIA